MSHTYNVIANRIPSRKMPTAIANRMKSLGCQDETTGMLRDMAMVLKLTAKVRDQILEEKAAANR